MHLKSAGAVSPCSRSLNLLFLFTILLAAVFPLMAQKPPVEKAYTIHYEMQGPHPETGETIAYAKKVLYTSPSSGLSLSKAVKSPEGILIPKPVFDEHIYFDWKQKKTIALHYFQDGDTLSVEQSFEQKSKTPGEATKEILGYLCHKAKVDCPMGPMEVWYTTVLGVKGGANFLGLGLGLILEVGNFKAVKIEPGIPKDISLDYPEKVGKLVNDQQLMQKIFAVQ
ncbi:MAG: hypothetical protein ACPGC5_00365 [Flavobacteriaceae bacterium]